MAEDIEVKLSPLDEESKQALLSFVGALKEVRNSMNEIKKQLVPDLAALTQAIQSAGGGGTVGSPGGIPGGGSNPTSERGPNASVATVNGPNVSYPSDQAGYGSVTGTGDENSPRRSSASSAASPGAPGFAKSASWYSDALRIPRINEFNIQDYSQMAGKVVAGRAASRYQDNYQQAVAEGASSSDAHASASYRAGAPEEGSGFRGSVQAIASNPFSDYSKMKFGQGAAGFGSLGPYIAATHNISPAALVKGYAFAPGLTQNMSMGMGVQGEPGAVGGTIDAAGSLIGISGGSNTAAHMFGQALVSHRELGDPNLPGVFDSGLRSKFAEAAIQENMGGAYGGGAFATALDSYGAAKAHANPIGGMDPAQYVTMFMQQIRNGAATQEEAAKNLKELGKSALTSGQNIQQLAEAAQAYHAANPQFSNARALIQTAGYANAGINGALANEIVQNPMIAGQVTLDQGLLPDQVAAASPDLVLESGNRVAERMMAQYANTAIPRNKWGETTMSQKEATTGRVARQMGITGEAVTSLLHGDEQAAMERLMSGQDAKHPKQFLQDLKHAQNPRLNTGKNQEFHGQDFGNLTTSQTARVLGASEKDRQKVLTDVVAEGMGYIEGGKGMPKTSQEYVDKMEKEAADALKQKNMVEVEFTGLAKTWFQQHKNELPKDPAGSKKKGVTPPPSQRYIPKGY